MDPWNNMGGSQKHYAEQKKPDSKICIHSGSIYMKSENRKKIMSDGRIRGFLGMGG